MQKVKGFIVGLRDFYVILMVIPLWLCSVYYRILPVPHIAWIDNNWNIICTLIYLHGWLALWQYIDKANDAQKESKTRKVAAGSVWWLAITLFLTSLGAVLNSNGVTWGYILFRVGIVAMPLFVFWIHSIEFYERKEPIASDARIVHITENEE